MVNITPFDTQENADWDKWRCKSKEGELSTVRSLACWSDICGFGSKLAKKSWKMDALIDDGLFNILSEAYLMLGQPFMVGVPPQPSERVLVINDGIARTLDIAHPKYIHPYVFLVYLRELFTSHYFLEINLFGKGLGLRTVLAGGERCQYAQEIRTGHSVLYYTNKPSEYGQKILDQTFVYNPAEFQMNTAFAAAYTIDSAGSKYEIRPNRVYITDSWLDGLGFAFGSSIKLENSAVRLAFKGKEALVIKVDKSIKQDIKGLKETAHRVSEVVAGEAFGDEETTFLMNMHDNW